MPLLVYPVTDADTDKPSYLANGGGYALPLVITNGYDPLHDDGQRYAAALEAAGTDTTYTNYPGLIHGVLTMRGVIDASTAMHDEIGACVRDHLRQETP